MHLRLLHIDAPKVTAFQGRKHAQVLTRTAAHCSSALIQRMIAVAVRFIDW